MPTAFDHTLAVLLVIVLPAYSAVTYRWVLQEIRDGGSEVRIAQYRRTIAAQWLLVVATVLVWLARGRAAGDLGLAIPGDMRSAAGALAVVSGLIVLLVQWRGIVRLTPEREASLRAQMAAMADLLPRTAREGRMFGWLAVTAGICEEILYRGFLIWYVGVFTGPWPAVAVTAVSFGLVHLYQGLGGVAKTGAAGLGAGVLYVATGSLVWPMVLHAALDLQGGAAARRVLGADAPGRPPG